VFRLTVSIALLVGHGIVVAMPARPLEQLPVGQYVRVSRSPSFPSSGRETGNLQILESSTARAKFRLELTMNPQRNDDGMLTRNGVIEDGEILVNGGAAIYRSAIPADGALGTCVLQFRRSAKNVVVVQSGKCWWFGEEVNASGMHRPAKAGEMHVVR
jgi:hypothetical protein